MYNSEIANKLIELMHADLKFREQLIESGILGEGYQEEMEELHNRHAGILEEIIGRIGYPTTDRVGEEASEAAWLIIQHAISKPEFMRKCVLLLEKAVLENKASAIHLAYLQDRIYVFEGKKQQFGTQFDWDKNGELSPNDFDDWEKVNQRRKSLGLNTLEEQIKIIRNQAERESQSPPADMEQRSREVMEWKKRVGWIA